jgi:H+/Cl- antiporter ClcA
MNGKNRFIDWKYMLQYVRTFAKWTAAAILIGVPCGIVGALFYDGVSYVTGLRIEHDWILFFLPLAGLFIVWFYRAIDLEGKGTDTIVEAAKVGEGLGIRLVPAIFIGTILTHLTGGSSGREGAALQIGGAIGNNIGKALKMKKEDLKITTMAGMAAFFAALFGTPITATVFVAFFLEVGTYYSAMLLPGFMAAMTAYGISRELGMKPFGFRLTAPSLEITLFVKVILLAFVCALVSNVFVKVLRQTSKLYKRFFPNPYLRVVVGALLVLLLTFLSGTRDYNGAGGDIIARAIVDGQAHPEAFLLKILFTALTLEAGFKGGEIVPSFFIGATFGCFFGSLIGIPAAFAAAIGLVTVFGGATNTLVASIFLSIEAFGSDGVMYFFMACVVSYLFSGYSGLYSKQTIRFSKLHARVINIRTNHRPKSFDHVRYDEDGVHVIQEEKVADTGVEILDGMQDHKEGAAPEAAVHPRDLIGYEDVIDPEDVENIHRI